MSDTLKTLREQWAVERKIGEAVLALAELAGLSAADLNELKSRLDREAERCTAWP